MAFSSRNLLSLARTALRAARHLAAPPAKAPRRALSKTSRTPDPRFSAPGTVAAGTSSARTSRTAGYPGDYTGRIQPVYAPRPDGAPDPGEVVWAWVPYEEDPSQGKDRPVLLIGRSGSRLLGLMLTTRDRNNSRGSDPAYLDIGSGAWDSKGRPSEVKLDRIITLDPADVRRQGAVVDRAVFERVADRLSALRG
ncbi:type II toxin-antitoxin system PemK/MazF family toxin [Arthrobacter sp. IK3]|uniref:type II toxin-antitoxin system PemK/MazF family toxin n=1 Tax=Arthrobacter sp. IK3 TaxID=3448169 RepID=UPI003EE0EED5